MERVIPATAVGRAKGSSIRPSIILFPGKEYRTKVQARMRPKRLLITAAIKEHKMLVPKAFTTLESVIIDQKAEGDNRRERTNTDARGISMKIESIKTVIPRVRPKPGIMCFFDVDFLLVSAFFGICVSQYYMFDMDFLVLMLAICIAPKQYRLN